MNASISHLWSFFYLLTGWMCLWHVSLYGIGFILSQRKIVPAQKPDDHTSSSLALMRTLLSNLLCCLAVKKAVHFITVVHTYQSNLQFDDYHSEIYIHINKYTYIWQIFSGTIIVHLFEGTSSIMDECCRQETSL